MNRARWFIAGFGAGIVVGVGVVLALAFWAGYSAQRSVREAFASAAPENPASLSAAAKSKSSLPSGAGASVVTPSVVGRFRRAATVPPKLPIRIEIDDTTAAYIRAGGVVYLYREVTDDWPNRDPYGILADRIGADSQYWYPFWADEFCFVRFALMSTGQEFWVWTNGSSVFVVTSPDKELARQFVVAYPY